MRDDYLLFFFGGIKLHLRKRGVFLYSSTSVPLNGPKCHIQTSSKHPQKILFFFLILFELSLLYDTHIELVGWLALCMQPPDFFVLFGKWVGAINYVNGFLVCITGTIWRSWPTRKGKLSWLNDWMLSTQQLLMMMMMRMMNECIAPGSEL